MLTKPIHFRIWQFKLFQTRPQDKWLFDRVTQAQVAARGKMDAAAGGRGTGKVNGGGALDALTTACTFQKRDIF